MQENKQKFWQESIKDENFLIDVDDSNVITDIQLMASNKETAFKKGDKFILELGEERKMFDEFQIAGTDLYVKKYLLKKLIPYESKIQLHDDCIKSLSSALQSEIIRCKECIYASKDDYTHCPYVAWWNSKNDFCSKGKRRSDE